MIIDQITPFSVIKEKYDVIMFDLWGVLVEGSSLYQGVSELINQLMLEKQVLFVSNSPRLRVDIAKKLQNFGINCDAKQFFTSGQMTHELLSSNNKAVIYYISNKNDTTLASADMNLTSDITKATLVLLAAHLDEGADLNMFDALFKNAISLGVPCICTNPDTIIPNQGRVIYCPGYFAEIYSSLGGKVVYIGKPGADIFIAARNSVDHANKKRVLMIGDTLEMDILGANRAGIDSALVMTGNTKRVFGNLTENASQVKAIQAYCLKSNIIPNWLTILEL